MHFVVAMKIHRGIQRNGEQWKRTNQLSETCCSVSSAHHLSVSRPVL